MDTIDEVRKPVVAGLFYPGNKTQLKNTILKFFKHTSTETIDGYPIGLISPHAGYEYSGTIAAEGYKQVQNQRYENVIIISPSHYDYFDGCSIYCGDYATPLGNIPTNRELATAIISASSALMESSQGHEREHALEVQLPFLQVALGNFQLVPIVMGCQDFYVAKELSDAVMATLSDSAFKEQATLIVGSSDLSHYHPADVAKQLDDIVLQSLQNFDEQQLWKDITLNRCQACGFGPIISTMQISRYLGANHSKVIAYGTSGEVTNYSSRVVGYASALFFSQTN
jgi:AmmeMemoRadiSam system protein B